MVTPGPERCAAELEGQVSEETRVSAELGPWEVSAGLAVASDRSRAARGSEVADEKPEQRGRMAGTLTFFLSDPRKSREEGGRPF